MKVKKSLSYILILVFIIIGCEKAEAPSNYLDYQTIAELELPFNNKAQRWLVQTHVQARTVSIQYKGIAYTFALMNKTDNSIKDSLGIKVLQVQKAATGKLELGHEIEQATMPRGRRTLVPVQKQGGNILQRGSPGSITNPNSGSGAVPNSGATGNYKQPNGKQNGQ